MSAISAKPVGLVSGGVPPAQDIQATLPPATAASFGVNNELPRANPTEPEVENVSNPPPYLPDNFHGFFADAKKDLIAFEGKISSIPHPNQGQMLELLQKVRALF